MVRVRCASLRFPMAAILPPRMPTSPEYQGEPVPSMMWPLVMTMIEGLVRRPVPMTGEWLSEERLPMRNSFL